METIKAACFLVIGVVMSKNNIFTACNILVTPTYAEVLKKVLVSVLLQHKEANQKYNHLNITVLKVQ